MNFLLRWLGLDTPVRGARLRPRAEIELNRPSSESYEATKRALLDVLGASITHEDARSIEGAIGLIDGERILCSFEAIDENRTLVRIESIRAISKDPVRSSQYVDRLAEELRR